MADIAVTTMRSALTSQALATMGVDPEWDRALTKYLRADALQFADFEFGAYDAAQKKLDYTEYALKSRFGENFRTQECAAAIYADEYAALSKVEDGRATRYLRPYWEAADELVSTPAPTLAAALFKVQVVYWEELNMRDDLGDKVMGCVEADMARLRGEHA